MTSLPVLHYELHGNPSSPPVVFLHGFMGNAADWGEVIGRLGRTHYCVAVDLSGHGKSLHLADNDAYTLPGAAQCVIEVMQHEQVVPAAVAGYSMGGRLALYLAIHYGQACSKLIVESATPGIRGKSERTVRRQVDEKRAQELERGRFEDFLRTWYRQPVFATLAEDTQKLDRILWKRRLNEPAELAKAIRGMSVGAQAPLWEYLPGLAKPVLLVAGQRDSKYVQIVWAMAELLPDAAVEIVSGAGHNVHAENASAVAESIERFLAKE